MINCLKKNVNSIAILKFKVCNTVTCIHNIDSKCMMKNCEMFERNLRQEY